MADQNQEVVPKMTALCRDYDSTPCHPWLRALYSAVCTSKGGEGGESTSWGAWSREGRIGL